jgi:DNA invertase Pin-like site-specific DNA recombinase
MRIGYARVSSRDQKLEIQSAALEKYGCDEIFKEKVSGAKKERPELQNALDRLSSGDKLVTYKLDRLGRSLNHLVSLINDLREKGIEFVSINENIDTSTSTGRLFFHIMAALAEFERELINERTEAGRAAAREKGETGGRPHKIKGKSLEMFMKLTSDPANTPQDVCTMLKISTATFYRIKARALNLVT